MTAAPRSAERDRAELLGQLFLGRSASDARLAMRADGDKTERRGLTERDLAEHVAGRVRFGAIPFVDTERVGWACIDLDARNWGHDPDDPEVWAVANGVIEVLAGCGIRGALERSKGKGWHVWTFFDVPVLAADVRALLRRVALEAGAQDESDLVCPRQDRRTDVGNGTWLPLFGSDAAPCTRFYTFDADAEEWLEAEDQAAFLLDLIARPSPAEAVPMARPNGAGAAGPTPEPDTHPCAWILEELRESGVELEGLAYGSDKIQFACPIHVAEKERARGGSAVMWSDGRGHCSSSKCDRKWRTVAALLALIGVKREAPRVRVLTAEEFEADVAPSAIVKSAVFQASTHSINGASKSGKTWAALQLAMAANAGAPFLGLVTVASPVLYLSLELSAGMLRGRMREIEAGAEIPMPQIGDTFHVVAPTVRYVPHLDLGTDPGASELERLIRETGARLVVLDTLYRFLPGADPNDNGEMGLVYGRLNDLAQRSEAALLLLDHVGKGEQIGPVSHSALGASVKGGAARVVIALRRTSREDGGRWQLDVESHFGSWEEPLYYERPRLPDGTRGGGCVLCTASEAHGLKFGTVRQLFVEHGDRSALGHPFFASKRQLVAALQAAKLASGNAQGEEMVGAIFRDYCIPEYAKARHLDRPILTTDGPRNAVVFTWRMAEPEATDR